MHMSWEDFLSTELDVSQPSAKTNVTGVESFFSSFKRM